MAKHHVEQILSALGDQITSVVGVPDRTVEHAKYVGYFSGLWYAEIKRACDAVSAPCPLEAFSWKQARKKLGDGKATVQEVKGKKVSGSGSVAAE